VVDAILVAAARVLVEDGYARATTKRMAEVAGVSIGSLYQYFPSKGAIAAALLRRHRKRVVEAFSQPPPDTRAVSLEVLVGELVRSAFEVLGLDPALHRLLIENVWRTTLRAELTGFEESLERALVEKFRERDDVCPADPPLTAFIIVRTVMAIMHSSVVDRPDYATDGRLVSETTQMILGYLERAAATQ
jgi:AcrR family transcriptional regulator